MASLSRFHGDPVDKRLAGYLDQAQRTPFAWGRHDCCMWLANWVFLMRGVDPAAGLRGAYCDEAGCGNLIKRYGGLPWLVGHCCREVGLLETGAPGPGDIGVVQALTLHGLQWVGAICTGQRWAMLSVGGLVSWRAEPAVAWSV